MSRRHDALIPLSHDHHHALRHARLLRKAADGDAQGRLSAGRTFADFFRRHAVTHFREEEEEIFPLVVGRPDAPMDAIVRILTEHVRLHALVHQLDRQIASSAPEPDTMRELAALLRDHVRFEEDVVFPAIEQLAPDVLEGVRLPPRDRT